MTTTGRLSAGVKGVAPTVLPHHIVPGASTRIIIDKGALEAGEPAIQVVREHTYGINRTNYSKIRIGGKVTIEQYATPQQDGTRIALVDMSGLIEVMA